MTNCDGASGVDSRQTQQSVSRGERWYMYSISARILCGEGGSLVFPPVSTGSLLQFGVTDSCGLITSRGDPATECNGGGFLLVSG